MKDEETRSVGTVDYKPLNTPRNTNAVAGIRCHLYALVQAVNELGNLQEGGKAFAGAQG